MNEKLENQLNPADKSVQWYFHPIEKVRMLRYFQLNTNFDTKEDYTVQYKENPNIGVVIQSKGNIAYIELQLHFLKNINHINNILIYNNYSTDINQVKQLAKIYNIEIYIPHEKLWGNPSIGNIEDIDCIYNGLIWSKSKHLDILVKLDEKLIPCFNWTEDLIKLALESNASTFSSYCERDQTNFRIDCIGLSVDIWSKSYPLQNLLWTINNQYVVYNEFWLHELCKTLSGNNYSTKWKNYWNNHTFGYLHSGYAMWQDILGINKYSTENRHENVLFNEFSKKEDYLNISKFVFGNKYLLKDF